MPSRVVFIVRWFRQFYRPVSQIIKRSTLALESLESRLVPDAQGFSQLMPWERTVFWCIIMIAKGIFGNKLKWQWQLPEMTNNSGGGGIVTIKEIKKCQGVG